MKRLPEWVKTGFVCAGLCVIAGVCAAQGTATATVSTVFCADPANSLLWKTVTADNPSVALEWPGGAMRAVLTVAMSSSSKNYVISDTSLRSYALELSRPTDAQGERVVNLTLEYFNGATSLASVTARLGLVMGTTSGEQVPFVASTASRRWTLAYSPVVLPVPADTTSLSVDSSVVPVADYDVPGWYAWRASAGNYTFVRGSASGDDAVTLRICGGTTVIFR